MKEGDWILIALLALVAFAVVKYQRKKVALQYNPSGREDYLGFNPNSEGPSYT